MSEKQAHLNGAYYGPAIPPKKSYHRPGRGSGCGLCGCCGCCLLTLLLQIVAVVVFTVGLAVFIFWLIFRPNLLKYHVTGAELTTFNVTSAANGGSTLNYDFAVNITLRNPNKRIGVYYDRIEARAYYEGERFDSKTLTPFYQGHKNTTVLSTSFQGQQVLLLSTGDLSDFNENKAAGVYNIDVKLYMRLRFKLKGIKTFRFKPHVKCDLDVPLGSAGVFQTTKCDFDW